MQNKIKKTYATVTENDGVDYRTMSDAMTSAGFKMNHSSARNHVLRVMKKFAKEYVDALGYPLDDSQLESMARSAAFQSAVSEFIGML